MERYPLGNDRAKFLTYDTSIDFWRFLKDLQAFEKECILREKQNEFLDAYSEYLKNGGEVMREKVQKLARELHRIDPGFNFVL